MNERPKPSLPVIRRLPRYHRFLKMLKQHGVERVSSKDLADMMNIGSSQIRQDFNFFGGFGLQGYGYNVDLLLSEISEILGIQNNAGVILIGMGNLGRVLARNMDFSACGFELCGIFDNSEKVIGKKFGGFVTLDIADLEEFCRKNKPDAAVLCIPKESAQPLVERLIENGVKGFWNFSHYDISVSHSGIFVENVHLGDSLMSLSFIMKGK